MNIQMRYGRVCDLDNAKAMAKVEFQEDKMVSPWLKISVVSSLGNERKHGLNINTSVWCLMDANGKEGLIGGAYYSAKNPPSITDDGIEYVQFEDGTLIQYDIPNHKLTIDCAGEVLIKTTGGKIDGPLEVTGDVTMGGALSVADDVTVDGDVSMNGELAVSLDVTMNASLTVSETVDATGDIQSKAGVKAGTLTPATTVSLLTHTHSGVTPGSGASGPPVPAP